MISVSLKWIAEQVEGRLIGSDCTIDAVSTDTRADLTDALFIALKGKNFDAHDFVEQAIAKGAAAIICEKKVDSECRQIIVENSRHALGRLGAAIKAKVAPKTVAVTGSNGKTTVKEMLAAILSIRHPVLATQGNFNNDIGVPLTLLRLQEEHKYAVVELGANHPGEIAYTTDLVKPDVAILNNVSAAHVEGFGSLHGVARAKTEIFRGVGGQGTGITPRDSEFYPCWQRACSDMKWKTFGLSDSADVYASDVTLNSEGHPSFTLHLGGETKQLELKLSGRHNVLNALSAAAAASELGISLNDIANGLQQVQPAQGRLTTIKVSDHLRIIDDTYNASVASTKAALDLLGSYQGYRIFVLGDMGELGADARAYHEDIGEHAIGSGIDNLYSLGVLSQSASEVFNGHGGKHFGSLQSLVESVLQRLTEQTGKQPVTVLVKGSRSAHMERVVAAIQQAVTVSDSVEDKHAC
ncbi:UDP-N-acetylmuramoyl-tripeptide--D-alanyl-D-alanine ligase [Idiomarina loihiensis]|uniref:UDP-N-acetylmuramoyl-tripeptide--D-alanyl-D- alanine ligase n=1 Tax=Idiomarina loihiensis TaxID=135577 RepID=UPI000C0CEBFF|nr:UDP-N-acetylmuramoyl-tripeptide--D-alanyl-D-alanine ligase [Idiomarina loihiensis]MRJ45273.1 UDP-N-acetylmuramoyl-tripeptide--D-alanyl-D-alanine ligase [Idiomarina loihiensis]PHQ92480.1 MAG: UDP-N-acetylmuramoyl-tripeptide--D-alanyl-D-alanine ligase [Idiomarina sp.]UTW32240.1 UDP-N-acetylmuramoyl-tripeptide--D-alanyl-D-alanine ligase [Idiomarina loihiensis]